MKKAAIVTLYGNSNFGNKLQNFAVQEILKNNNYDVETLRIYNSIYKGKSFFKNRIRYIIKKFVSNKLYRNKNFKIFEKKYLNNSKKVYFSNEKADLKKKYDIFVIGSDQVWNPHFGLKHNFRFMDGMENKFSLSASFGVNEIEDEFKDRYKKGLESIKNISVREEQGKKIIKEICGRNDVEVLIDPTMMIDIKIWDDLIKKPKMLKSDKFILNYFLGELSEEKKSEIERIAKENNCDIINILDKNSDFYKCGPSEFLYLEKNAYLVCTDSFHSCVFAFLFNKPFVIFDREQKGAKSMNSRLETFLSKFKLVNRTFDTKITKENLQHNYDEAYDILEKERINSIEFIKNAVKY